jgi:2,5-diketo-D-gluconate reductase A
VSSSSCRSHARSASSVTRSSRRAPRRGRAGSLEAGSERGEPGRFRSEGLARSIGVSNFQVEHLERLAAECEVVPAVNQIELHPYFQNDDVDAYGREHGIVTEAWSPIAQGEVLGDAVVGEVAAETGRTAAQVVLRWHIQRGNVVFPKTTNPDRMRENLDVLGFELSAEQASRIDALDRGESGRIGPHPDIFAWVPA